MSRTCRKCNKTKTLEVEFYKNSCNRGGGFNYQCKECCKEYGRKYGKAYVYSGKRRDGNGFFNTRKGLFSSYKGESKRKELIFELDFEFFNSLISLDCFYCGISSNQGEKIGVDRVNNDIGYTLSNCVPCCSKCNYSKRDRTSESFIEHCIRVVEFQKQKVTNTNLVSKE